MKIRRKPQHARRYEAQVLDIKAALARGLRRRRAAGKISQGRLAARLGSSQSRVSKIEAGDPAVSLDLFIRALFAAGATRGDIARAMGSV
jgi:transcriptional regulator with XRE-family HTH domain